MSICSTKKLYLADSNMEKWRKFPTEANNDRINKCPQSTRSYRKALWRPTQEEIALAKHVKTFFPRILVWPK